MLTTLRVSASRTAWSGKITAKLLGSSCSVLFFPSACLWRSASPSSSLCVANFIWLQGFFFKEKVSDRFWPLQKLFGAETLLSAARNCLYSGSSVLLFIFVSGCLLLFPVFCWSALSWYEVRFITTRGAFIIIQWGIWNLNISFKALVHEI